MSGSRSSYPPWFFWLVALMCTAPAWIVKHPPLQDMPFHLATLRILHDQSNPLYGLSAYYQTNLFHTQYLLYYLCGTLLAYPLGIFKANVVLMSFYLGGTPLALRSLLSALGKDARLCLFVVPLLVSTMFTLGLLPYVFGTPLMLWAIAASVRYFDEPTAKHGVVVALLAILVFYSHIVPFALFGLAFALLFPWDKPASWLRLGAPVVPSLGLLAWWLKASEAGRTAGGGFRKLLEAAPLREKLPRIFAWLAEPFKDGTHEIGLVAIGLLALVAIGLSVGDKERTSPIARRFWVVPVACVILYFTTGSELPPFWLFCERFPITAAMTAIPLLRFPVGIRGTLLTAALLGVGGTSIVNTCKHFIQFELKEVGAIEEAIEAIGPRKKVAGLMYDPGSESVPMAPFIHYVSYYQVEKGGLVQFSYSGFPHWPVQYRAGAAPPNSEPLRLRWEWTPEQVPMRELFPFYDYVLTRGSGFRPPPGTFHIKWSRGLWTVWESELLAAKPTETR